MNKKALNVNLLMAAIRKSHVNSLRRLLRHSNPETCSKVLYLAFYHGDIKLSSSPTTVRLLLEHGADADINNTPLPRSCRWGLIHLVKLLLEHGADVNVKEQNGQTPLHEACGASHSAIARLLIEHGADVNARDNLGRTALYACNDPAIARLLVEAGADVNARGHDGNTPLHRACCIPPQPEVAQVLLEAGADVNAQDEDGRTPLDIILLVRDTSLIQGPDQEKFIDLFRQYAPEAVMEAYCSPGPGGMR